MGQMAKELEAAGLGIPDWASPRALTERRRTIRRQTERPAAGRRTVRQRHAHGSARERSTLAPARNRARTENGGLIDINEATYEELRSLKLSTTQSRRLLAYRRRVQGFSSLSELDAIPGFPSAILDQLKQRLST
jgi:DNA uptake protein ComE-like DNA-binding protein